MAAAERQEVKAVAKWVRMSPRKARLVAEHIRGRSVPEARTVLAFTPRAAARELEKVLRSAVANAQQKEGFGGDVERLFVQACYANQGPSMKRVRPAPMGRAFRVVKRTAHLTVRVAERPSKIVESSASAPDGATARPRRKGAAPKKKTSAARAPRKEAKA